MDPAPCAVWEGSSLLELFLKNEARDHIPRPTGSSVKKSGYAMVVQQDESLTSIFRKLTAEGFLGAPVLHDGKLVGHITMLDLVKYVNSLFFGTSQDEWATFWAEKLQFSAATAGDVIYPCDEYNRCPFLAMNEKFTSFAALETMARCKNHQIVLLNDEKKVCSILTQSMLISFLRQSRSKWDEDFRQLKVKDFTATKSGLEQKNLAKVKETDPAINAFLMMEEEDVHGLPIVDEDGVLTGCISVRDLRGVGMSGASFFRLYHPVKTFKQLCLRDYPRIAPTTHYSRKDCPDAPVYVTPESTMEDVVDAMEDGNLHRVFICSQESHRKGRPKPIGVISQSDILYQTLLQLIDSADVSGGTSTKFPVPPVMERQSPRKLPAKPRTRSGGAKMFEPIEEKRGSPTKTKRGSPSKGSPSKRSIVIS